MQSMSTMNVSQSISMLEKEGEQLKSSFIAKNACKLE